MQVAEKEKTAAILSKETIAQLKAQHPNADLHMLSVEDGSTVVCKAPSRAEYKRCTSMILDAGKKANALETLLLGCRVYPEPEMMVAMIERQPALADIFGERLLAIAGAGQEVTEKKL